LLLPFARLRFTQAVVGRWRIIATSFIWGGVALIGLTVLPSTVFGLALPEQPGGRLGEMLAGRMPLLRMSLLIVLGVVLLAPGRTAALVAEAGRYVWEGIRATVKWVARSWRRASMRRRRSPDWVSLPTASPLRSQWISCLSVRTKRRWSRRIG
jgi:hypothetical protein